MKKTLLIFFVMLSGMLLGQNMPAGFRNRLDINQIESRPGVLNGASDKLVAEELLKVYRQKETLYLRAIEADLASIKKEYPADVKMTMEVADQVRKNYFIFRYEWDMEKTNVPYQFKKEIDWLTVPFGDNEWAWMLNRHRYWMDLGKAYYFTKNEAYAKAWVAQVVDWIQKNPVTDLKVRPLAWRRIEAGIRCENWIKSFELMKNSPAVTPQFLCIFLNSMAEHADFINSAYTDFSQTSNWGVLEFHGLFNAANFLTEFNDAPKWRADAIQRLEICAQTQILPDGTQWEQSPMYHNEVFHCFMNVNLIAQRKGITLPQLIVDKTKAMALANVKWQKPNHHQPLLGDSDDSDLRALLTLAAYLFNDGTLKSQAYATPDYDNQFVLGTKGADSYKNISTKKPDFTSTYLHSSGDIIMRNSWEENANYMNFNVKKLGCGHAHDNLLHFALFADGKDYLVDGGRYTYVDGDMRKQLKSSQSHNTLAVDDLPNSVYAESWSNSFNARSQGVYTRMTDLFDYAEAENTAYKRLKDPVSMKRRILFIKPGLWIVFDSFQANSKHKYSQYFNFPDNEVQTSNNQATTTYANSNLMIQAVKPVSSKIEARKWSPEYNMLKDNKRVEFFKESVGFESFITALYFPDKSKVNVSTTPVYDRMGKLLDNKTAEAVRINCDGKEWILLVVHNSQSALLPFFKVNDVFLSGEVVLLQKVEGKYLKHIIKE